MYVYRHFDCLSTTEHSLGNIGIYARIDLGQLVQVDSARHIQVVRHEQLCTPHLTAATIAAVRCVEALGIGGGQCGGRTCRQCGGPDTHARG